MDRVPQISEGELEVMNVIWEYAPISTNDIVDKVSRKSHWSPKTIQTMLFRLEKKGAVNHRKESRVFVYSPLIDKENYVAEESNSFLQKFYNGALNKMVLNFLENDMLSKSDIDELKRILEEKKE